MNILIVDDRPENLLALEAVLNSPDYCLISASSGEEALKCLLKDDFAVILLDVQMPGMDGFETASLIRQRKRNKDTPIIFTTAIYQSTENMVQGYSLGAIDYLFKPFQPQTLKFKIAAFVKIHLREKQITFQNELLTQRAAELEKVNISLERTTSDLRKAEALARVIGETATDTVITLDEAGRILNVNPAVTEMFGYRHDELQGQHVSRLFPSAIPPFLENLVMSKGSKILDVAAACKDGTVFFVEVQIGLASLEEQQIFVWSVRDITERKQLEKERKDRLKTLGKLVQVRTGELFLANEKLKEEILERKNVSQRLGETSLQLTNILESITDAFFTLNHQWKFIFVNEEAEKYWQRGREELIGRDMWGLFSEERPEYYPLFIKAMNSKESSHFEIMGTSDMSYEVHVYPSTEGLSVYYHDISERRMFKKKMARLDRLNLVGQMAAGIAHEIRNPMTTVRGYLQLLGSKPAYEDKKETFDLMISELDRANAIITQFLSLARTQETELEYQDLNDLLRNLYPLLEADTFTQNKQISFIPGKIPNLELNGKEITQLVLNLTRNGLEAMPERGCLNVESYVEDGKVVLAIADEGCGIPTENLRMIGTPFFTTKDSGTGLGLATCYKIAESHNAKIDIDSSSRGTTFLISFPIPVGSHEIVNLVSALA